MQSQDSRRQSVHTVLDDRYDIRKQIGEGNTSKVYLCRDLQLNKSVAVKVIKDGFLRREENSFAIENEIKILTSMDHPNVIKCLGWSDKGVCVKKSGRVINDLVYLVVDYVKGSLMFEVCQLMGGMGEDAGRFFLGQLLDAVSYLHSHNIVHRDLKLENILIDSELNLHIADFGFAVHAEEASKLKALSSYRGTKTYMAPEIKEGKVYSGFRIDLFSVAVILFIVVKGTFPFLEAKRADAYYSLLMSGQVDAYLKAVGATTLSPEFQDLIVKMFAFDPEARLTESEIRAHPWMANSSFDGLKTKLSLEEKVATRRR